MLVYLFVILLILFFRYDLGLLMNGKKERQYVLVVCIVFVLLVALQWLMPETDIEGYMFRYKAIQNYSFQDIIDTWQDNYFVYFFLSKLFAYTGLSYHFWFGFVQFVFLSGFVRLVNKFTTDRLFCLLLFFTIGLFSFSMHGLKQTLAMGIVWHAFVLLYDKKYLTAVLLSVLAFYTHKTASFFMLSFIIVFVKDKKWFTVVFSSILILTMAIAPTRALFTFTNLLDDTQYSQYLNDGGGYSYTTFLFFLMLFFIALFSNNKGYKNQSNSTLVVSFATISVFGNLLAQISSSTFRLALYYTPFLILMVSNRIKDDNIKFIVMLIAAFYMLYTGRHFPYKFFWQ